MPRIVDISWRDQSLPERVSLAVGDVLSVSASGGRVRKGSAVELLGIYTTGVIGPDGAILSPLGPPGAVLFRAREQGRCVLEIVAGDPFRPPATTRTLRVDVV